MAVTQVESYEEVRRRKLEENKRKLEEVKLGHLYLSLREASAPRTSPAKQVKRKPAQEGHAIIKRRSNRIANLPEQAYREVIPEVVHCPRKISKHRDLSGHVYASDEARAYTIEKARELEGGLDAAYPSFVKPMLQSHTTGGFWLSLPIQFCNKHLPKCDSTIVLVDENGDESPTTYLAQKRGLSAGWRRPGGFAIDHELVDGDALVFQLIKPTTFKVYIIRASSYDGS